MTKDKARKILGKKSLGIPDEQLQTMLDRLHVFSVHLANKVDRDIQMGKTPEIKTTPATPL